jgi:predicted phosphodiesterase
MTETLDLGRRDGPLLVFGGPYGNAEATRALFGRAAMHGIAPADMICTGDVVAYCADAEATARLVAGSGVATVMGNCEESLGTGRDDCGCGFADRTRCDVLSRSWFTHAERSLSPEMKGWMAGLPRRVTVTLGGRRLVAVHGAPSTINRYVFASTPDDVVAAEIATAGADGVIAGHSGLPFTRIVGGRLWHNAGVVGLPANDGTPRTWYAILTPEDDGAIRVVHHPLAYDHEAAAARMRAEGLPEAYARTLQTGLWDNCEILPAAETALQGAFLAPGETKWN